MPSRPFARLTRKTRLQAGILKLRRALGRPFRPDRLRARRTGPANLLLIGIDTLRADHLGCYGYGGGPVSPHLDRLVQGGTLFQDVTAPAPWTLPSFSSALTGVMPGLHGAYLTGKTRNMDTQPPRRLNTDTVTLAAHLRRQGYRTAAFYSNQFFAFGLAESFDEHHYHNLAAEDLAAVAREWIRTHADGPFFCFILFNDPHEPTTPSRQDLAPFWPRALAAGAPDRTDFLEGVARWGAGPQLSATMARNSWTTRNFRGCGTMTRAPSTASGMATPFSKSCCMCPGWPGAPGCRPVRGTAAPSACATCPPPCCGGWDCLRWSNPLWSAAYLCRHRPLCRQS